VGLYVLLLLTMLARETVDGELCKKCPGSKGGVDVLCDLE
jgi:hypothetical protein